MTNSFFSQANTKWRNESAKLQKTRATKMVLLQIKMLGTLLRLGTGTPEVTEGDQARGCDPLRLGKGREGGRRGERERERER